MHEPDTIRAVVIDLDGTLLNRSKKISGRSRRAIHKVMERGIPVFIATGRSLHTSQRYIQELALPFPFICYNGSCIYDPMTREDMFHTRMSEDVCREIMEIEQKVSCSFHAYRNHEVHSLHAERSHSALSGILGSLSDDTADFSDFDALSFTKVLFTGDFGETEKVRAHLTRTFGEEVHQVYSRPCFFEVMRSGATKAHALDRLLKYQKIEPHQVMAIGDENNDLAMLRMVGHPVAMGNGTKEIKEAARYHTAENDEDGVALIIEKMLLS